MKKHLMILITLYAMLSGCATVQPLAPETTQGLLNGKIAVGYLQLEKRIEYEELLYKVLWNEQRTQTAVFDGLWDIDSNLSTRLSKKLNEQGMNTQPVQTVFDQNELKEYHKVYLESDAKGLATRKTDYKITLTSELVDKLNREQVNYLLVLYSDYIYSYSQTGLKQVHSRSQMSVIDVSKNEEIYFGPMSFGGKPKVEKSIREIEQNNLAGLKTIMNNGIDMVATVSIPNALGFTK